MLGGVAPGEGAGLGGVAPEPGRGAGFSRRDGREGRVVALKKVRFDTTQPESVRFMAREMRILRQLDQAVWVEHVEVVGEEKPLQPVFKDYVTGGAAFGATRWVSILQRQCERLANELAHPQHRRLRSDPYP